MSDKKDYYKGMEIHSWEEAEMEATFQKESEVVDLIEFEDDFYKTLFPNKTEEDFKDFEGEEDLF